MRTHGPLCIFICPSVLSIHRTTRCSPFLSLLSVHFLSIHCVCQQSSSPLNTFTIHPLLYLSVPYCTIPPSAPPLHPRWTECTLCSKINFEINEGMAVCACSVIFCQKCSEGYFLIYLLPRLSTFVSCSFLGLCSDV